ncbi:MAG: ribosomal-processing cysteine protease Prp [Bacillota bacterium]
MIKVKIIHKGNNIQTIESSGHSGYGQRGKDIVCSAVSAVIQTALIGLMDVSKNKVLFERKDGYLRFSCPTPQNKEEETRQQAILRTMYLGLKDLQSGYNAFIRMEEI